VLEATEGELEREIWVGDAVTSVREVSASEKASHRGHGGHRGELEKGTGFGDAVASVREVRVSEKASHRGHELGWVMRSGSCIQLFLARITISTRRLSCCSSTDLSAGTIRRVLPKPCVWIRSGLMFMFPTTHAFTVSARRWLRSILY
jgi:hypothetical protein